MARGAMLQVDNPESAHHGREFPVSPICGDIRISFRNWMIDEAVAELNRLARTMTSEMYKAQFNEILVGRSRGDYDWEEPACRKKLFTLTGFAYHSWLRLIKGTPNLTINQVIESDDLDASGKRVSLISSMDLKDVQGNVIVPGAQRMQMVFALADGWEPPDPKVMPPILQGALIQDANQFLDSVLKTFPLTF